MNCDCYCGCDPILCLLFCRDEREIIERYFWDGFSYRTILQFLAEYHDIHFSYITLRRRLQQYGPPFAAGAFGECVAPNSARAARTRYSQNPQFVYMLLYIFHALSLTRILLWQPYILCIEHIMCLCCFSVILLYFLGQCLIADAAEHISTKPSHSFVYHCNLNKKLSYRPGTARCVVSVEILPIAMQECRNYLYEKSWTNRSYEVGGLRWVNVQ